jgi:hypothetical protein
MKGGGMLGINLKKQVLDQMHELHKKSGVAKQIAVSWSGGNSASMVHGIGDDAYITLPTVEDEQIYSTNFFNQVLTYGFHELGHVWFTDPLLWDFAYRIHGYGLADLINGLEDVRIEQEIIKHGYVKQAMFESLINRVLIDGSPDTKSRLSLGFILACEGRRLNGYRIKAAPMLDRCPWASDLWWALMKLKSAKRTSDVVTISIKLFRRLEILH